MRFFYDRNHKMCTKSVILSVMIMLLTAPLSGCFSSDAMADNVNHDLPDPDLRINHLQMKGTHNSYHVEPIISPTREYMYTHETLDVQAADQGVRQFEIDVWWDPRGGLRVCTIINMIREQHALHLKIAWRYFWNGLKTTHPTILHSCGSNQRTGWNKV